MLETLLPFAIFGLVTAFGVWLTTFLSGRTTRAKADEYAKYLYETGIKPLEEKALAVQQLREDRETETEFITISYWENVDAMSRFTGADPRQIHHLPRDKEFLIELPQSVQVLTITSSHNLFSKSA